MKVRATLEFDLDTEAGGPITDRPEYVWAAEAADDAIRSRLMGQGFLDDVLIGTYSVDTTVIGDPEPPSAEDLMSKHDGPWGEHPRYPARDWQYEVANHDTRLDYWDWLAARLVAEQQP